jgi:hypothetical protein
MKILKSPWMLVKGFSHFTILEKLKWQKSLWMLVLKIIAYKGNLVIFLCSKNDKRSIHS